jgi:hypothetical protein
LRLPNESGQLSNVSSLLGENGLNIIATTVSIDADMGILCMVLDDHVKGIRILKGAGYEISETPVIAAYVPNHPGGMNAVTKPLKSAGVNIDRFYVSVARKGENALIIIEVDDYEKAAQTLKENYVDLIEGAFRF